MTDTALLRMHLEGRAVLLTDGTMLVTGQPLGPIEDAVVANPPAENPVSIVLSLTALVLLGTVFEALSGYVLERTAESVVLAARRSLVGRLLRLRIAEVDRALRSGSYGRGASSSA
ncbi:hypothetical protein AB0442_38590 [Kitasatospora sp. NPDC085895]|uniref:hypothetical protein n=1 Tax=Kitasatospora sp. NPDC085895 TaxID=3155057 RepID=UPI00344CB372